MKEHYEFELEGYAFVLAIAVVVKVYDFYIINSLKVNIMKKKNLKLLKLNKKSVSNLSFDKNTIVGGATVFPCPVDSEQMPCQSITHCNSEYQECNSQKGRTCQTIPGYCQTGMPLCPPR